MSELIWTNLSVCYKIILLKGWTTKPFPRKYLSSNMCAPLFLPFFHHSFMKFFSQQLRATSPKVRSTRGSHHLSSSTSSHSNSHSPRRRVASNKAGKMHWILLSKVREHVEFLCFSFDCVQGHELEGVLRFFNHNMRLYDHRERGRFSIFLFEFSNISISPSSPSSLLRHINFLSSLTPLTFYLP